MADCGDVIQMLHNMVCDATDSGVSMVVSNGLTHWHLGNLNGILDT